MSSTKFKTARAKARHPTEHIQTGVLCLKWDTLTQKSLLLPVTCYCLPSASLLPPLQVPFFTHSKERTWNGLEAKEKRTWNGGTTDLQRNCIKRKSQAFFASFRRFSSILNKVNQPGINACWDCQPPMFYYVILHNSLIIFILGNFDKQVQSRPVTSNR